ncbi:MAG: site-specific integrase [Lachnospiraceae bacterium]|nr:site-specific integrase [Lachnospiraceae bacterium]
MGIRGENIRKRADGRWEARVVQGMPVSGKTNYKYLYGKTYQEAKQKKKEFQAKQRDLQGMIPMASVSDRGNALLRDVANEWLAVKKAVVRESTCACYAFLIERHLLPTLGGFPVGEIDSPRLAEFLEKQKRNGRLSGGPLSDKTISDIKAVLMQILRFAKRKGLIDTLPECRVATGRPPETSVLTKQDQKKVEAQAMKEDTAFSLGIFLSLYGGLRIGEVCGLQWGDFDFQNGTVCIQKTVQRIAEAGGVSAAKTKVVVGTPKTDCSIRTIPLPTQIFHYLAAHRGAGDCYVLTGSVHYMEPRVCLDRYKRLLRRAGVADHTFHTLRHTFAPRCVESGVDIKSLSEIMGHSDVKITLQRYVHPSMDAKKAEVDKLSSFLASGQIRGQDKARIARNTIPAGSVFVKYDTKRVPERDPPRNNICGYPAQDSPNLCNGIISRI